MLVWECILKHSAISTLLTEGNETVLPSCQELRGLLAADCSTRGIVFMLLDKHIACDG